VTSEPLRLGIVGCGGISERHARAAAGSAAAAIVACCDIRAGAAEDWAARHGCERAYADYRAMIREHELDGVLLATWPNLHHEQVLGCLEEGVRAVLCEKSLAVTGAEALEIWTAADEADALVVEGLMYLHHPAIRRIDELLAAGELGEIDSVRAVFSLVDTEESAPDDPSRDWRQRADRAGGVPYDLACYCVDACNRLAGAPPRRALAVAGKSARYGTVSRLFGLLEYGNGVVGAVESSKGVDFDHALTVNGARGRLLLPVAWRIDHPTEVTLARSVGWGLSETTRFPAPVVDVFRLQLEAFAASVRGEAPPVPTLAESVVNAFTLDALLESAAHGVAADVAVPEAVRA
jgi:D-xylose 1-dehydrogenase (NADP+, D-xylono-1,5-lactone-forming)